MSEGKYEDSVREAIHAVESAAGRVAGNALKALEKDHALHPALKQGFEKLYAYTSDADGIRHANFGDEGNVGEAEALFMFGACASFVAYLNRKFLSPSA